MATLSQKMRAAGGASPSTNTKQQPLQVLTSPSSSSQPPSPDKRSHLLHSTSTVASPHSPDKLPSLVSLSPKDKFVAALMRDAERTIHESGLAYRHSSTANFLSSSSGPYVDVGVSLHPSAQCVRCSSHASICVPCGEVHTNEALAFYRKSIGAGASAILNQAITEAGLGTTVKAFCFQLWRNSLKAQEAHRNVVFAAAAAASDRKYMKGPFEAWRKYAKQEVIDKKNKRIEELQNKATSMEKTMEQLVLEKDVAVKTTNAMKARLDGAMAIEDGYKKTVAALEAELERERARVVALAGLCGPMVDLLATCDEHTVMECLSFEPILVDMGKSVPSQNWGHIYPPVTRETIVRLLKKREDRIKEEAITGRLAEGDYLAESAETVKAMLQWVNHTSRMVKEIDTVTADGDTFDSLLPRHEQVYDLAQLKTGRTLARTVFSLIHFGADMDRTLEEVTPEGRMVYSNQVYKPKNLAPAAIRVRPTKHRAPLTMAQIKELKELEDDAEPLLEHAVQLAVSYLGLPPFKVSDLLAGAVDALSAFVGSLMFMTNPLKEERDVTNTAALLDEQLKMFSEMGFCHGRLGYATRGMKEIRRATDRYLGVHVDDASKAEATTRDDTASEATATHSSATTGASAASAADGGGGGGGGDDPAANYARLSAAIDALAATNETDLLKDGVVEMTAQVKRLQRFREVVHTFRTEREASMRLANDVRCFAMASWSRQLFKPMGLLDGIKTS